MFSIKLQRYYQSSDRRHSWCAFNSFRSIFNDFSLNFWHEIVYLLIFLLSFSLFFNIPFCVTVTIWQHCVGLEIWRFNLYLWESFSFILLVSIYVIVDWINVKTIIDIWHWKTIAVNCVGNNQSMARGFVSFGVTE